MRSVAKTVCLLMVVSGCKGRDASQLADAEGSDPRLQMYKDQEEWPGACRNATNPETVESQRQSPITLDIEDFQQAPRTPMAFFYNEGAQFQIVDNGHGIQANVVGDGGYLELEGNRYPLIQFHFHERSEHALFGNRYASEAHFVHAGPSGVVAVGVLLVDGDLTNPALEAFWQRVPSNESAGGQHATRTLVPRVSFNPEAFLPKEDYLIYNGSLTTPGCDETVIHAVSIETVGIGQGAVRLMQSYYQGTNRNLQPKGSARVRNYRVATLQE